MLETRLILSLILAFVEISVIYLLTKKSIVFAGWRKYFYYFLVLNYEMCNVPHIFTQIDRNTTKIILLLLIALVYLFFTKAKEIWGLAEFFCNILIFKSVCQMFKFIFLTIYCKAEMQAVELYMEQMPQTILVFYIVACLPGYFAAKYIWGQFLLCHPTVLKITGMIMLGIYFTTDFYDEWVQILTMMPCVLILFTVVNLLRIGYQNVGEQKLSYYKELEMQAEETERELLEIRKEVEKYYRQADEGEHYTEQLLRKIDEVTELK